MNRTSNERFPRVPPIGKASGWIIEPTFLIRVSEALKSVPEHYDLDLEHIEEVLLALEKVERPADEKSAAPARACVNHEFIHDPAHGKHFCGHCYGLKSEIEAEQRAVETDDGDPPGVWSDGGKQWDPL